MSDNIDYNFSDDEEMYMTLELENGAEVECIIITVFEAGGKDYIALLPTEGPEYDEGEVYIYRYMENEDEEVYIDNIENDEEWETASDAFDEWLDNQEFDELLSDEQE